eukprot:359926_1
MKLIDGLKIIKFKVSHKRRHNGIQLTLLTSIVNVNVALPGTDGGEPSAPYASFGGITNLLFPPTLIPLNPISHPFITSPEPNVKSKPLTLIDLSNTFLSSVCPT